MKHMCARFKFFAAPFNGIMRHERNPVDKELFPLSMLGNQFCRHYLLKLF